MDPGRIDVHHHYLPPDYVAWLRENGIDDAGGRSIPDWSAEATLDLMGKFGIAAGILSVSMPGTHLRPDMPDGLAQGWSRRVNEFAARLVQDHPGRFGFFATLAMPARDASVAEAAYALDTLGASGVVLLANAHGRYLGQPDDATLLAELDRRGAVVFVHPAHPPGPAVDGIPPLALDFLLDTARAAYLLVRNGFVRRFPGLKIILPHAGGFVPYASHRMAGALSVETGRDIADLLEDFRSFYFDTALSGSPAALPSLLAFAKPGHVLFGSDWPYAPPAGVGYFTGQLDRYPGLDAAGHAAIDRDGAALLFPRFA